MNIDSNDPRLTAFVLGELDPTERAVIEANLVESAECREAVEEIRLTTRWLSEQLQEESRAHGNTSATSALVVNHHNVAESILKAESPRRRWWGLPATRMNLIAAALVVLMGLAVLPFIRVDVQAPRELAKVEHDPRGEFERLRHLRTRPESARRGSPCASSRGLEGGRPCPVKRWQFLQLGGRRCAAIRQAERAGGDSGRIRGQGTAERTWIGGAERSAGHRACEVGQSRRIP